MLAHVKWFTEERVALDGSRLLSAGILAGVALAVAGAGVLWWVARRVDDERLTRWFRRVLRPYLPLILSVHLGIALAAYALTGRYLSPSLPLPGGKTGTLLAGLQLLVAALIVLGLFTRAAAGLLVLSGPVGMLFYGVVPVVERAELLGIALYLALVGRRRFAIESRWRSEAPEALNPWAVALLRMCAGVAVAFSALTEKLLAPGVSLDLLAEHPALNVVRGLGMSDAAFVQVAGAVELALGLILLSGVGTRLAVLVAVIPFNLTLLVFGWTELLGHLPIYGIFLVLLIEGPGRLTRPLPVAKVVRKASR
ncbi:MAG TPA: hypothetical protein VGB28_01640 [Actinomycetota bacterium]